MLIRPFLVSWILDRSLPEEVIFSDHLQQFKSHLPPFQMMLQGLNIMIVSDPVLNSSVNLLKEVIFRYNIKHNIRD